LRVAAGVAGLGGAETIAEYHRRVFASGSTPMDEAAAEPVTDDLVGALRSGLQRAAAVGLGGITEAGMSDWRHWDALVELRSLDGGLPVSVRVLVASGAADVARMDEARSQGDASLAVLGVKFYCDGWLGPRTCACSLPFADGDGDAGILFMDGAALASRAAPYAEAGWVLATHAIGDRAIEAVLDAYAAIYGSPSACRAAAPRIEHAQVLRPDLIDRMATWGVVACIQPSFAVSDAEAAALALAGRFPEAYRWDLLVEAGVPVIAGSDFPIETLDPNVGIERLTTGDHPLPRDVALRMMTAPF
jgi:predicted amidohydrolase YtcJ